LTASVSGQGTAIGIVYVRLFPLYLLNQPTFELEFLA